MAVCVCFVRLEAASSPTFSCHWWASSHVTVICRFEMPALRFHRMANDVKVEQNYSRIQSKRCRESWGGGTGRKKPIKVAFGKINFYLLFGVCFFYYLELNAWPYNHRTQAKVAIHRMSYATCFFAFYLHLFTVTVVFIPWIWCSIISILSELKISHSRFGFFVCEHFVCHKLWQARAMVIWHLAKEFSLFIDMDFSPDNTLNPISTIKWWEGYRMQCV